MNYSELNHDPTDCCPDTHSLGYSLIETPEQQQAKQRQQAERRRLIEQLAAERGLEKLKNPGGDNYLYFYDKAKDDVYSIPAFVPKQRPWHFERVQHCAAELRLHNGLHIYFS